MSTFYSTFPDSIRAQQLLRHLLEDGISLDDLSLVSRDGVGIEGVAMASTGDASYFVGRPDDPDHDLVDESAPDADYEAEEASRVGGGISTSDSATNVETVEEMDESQEVAELEGWPRQDTSHSRHELDDLDRAVRTGFPTPVTPLDNEVAAATEQSRSVEPVAVPGVGLVFGGGDLATAAFDWAGSNGEPDAPSFLTYLQDEGVPPATSNDLLSQFANGNAILAVALGPEVDEEALEEVAAVYGAVTTGWFGAPRF